MKILIVSQFFDPEPTLKGLSFAKALVDAGHEVEVLTGYPNYPLGEIYPGFEMKIWSQEVIDGVRVSRVPLFPSHDRSSIKRLITYGSFALSATCLGPWLVKRPDVVYVYHPPLTSSIPAIFLKSIWQCPVVMDIQDLWPDTLASTGMVSEGALTKLIGSWAKVVYRLVDDLVVLSPGFLKRLVKRGVPENKVHVIYNWNEESRQAIQEPDHAFAKEWGLEGKFNVMFAGTLGPAQALDTVLEAAKICQSTCPIVQFVFVGGGIDRDRLQELARDNGLQNVRFVPAQPMEAMGGILPLASALVVHLKDNPLFAITIPSKTQAYLAAGVPVIMAVRGDAAELASLADAGPVIPPEDPQSMADAVKNLCELPMEARRQLGKNGQAYYAAHLATSIGVQSFIERFKVVTARSRRGPDYRDFGKRLLDLAIVIPTLIFLLPLFLVLAVAIRLTMGSPVIYRQRRAGRNGTLFTIYKFRSMTDARNADGELLKDSERIPPFGAFLRRSSLDELPGLFNVLIGEMSLVGPRPLLPEYLPNYSARHAKRHDVLPGVTGIAQIRGRQLALFSERMEMDVYYAENVSFLLDMKILFQTIPKVFGARGFVLGQQVQDVDDIGLSRSLLVLGSDPEGS